MASKWWVSSTALLIMMAGCLEAAPGNDDEATQDVASLDGGNETVAANTPPLAALAASALNGTAPLNVTLELTGSDADGDNLTWSLVLGNDTVADGTSLPASVNQTLDAGNHTFVLTVSDGIDSAQADLTVVVADVMAAPSGPCGAEPEPCIVGEDAYAIFWSDGRCDAQPDQVYGEGGYYVNERGDPPGTGQLSGGTWIYEESNGIEGMQIDGAFEGGTYAACVGGDLGHF